MEFVGETCGKRPKQSDHPLTTLFCFEDIYHQTALLPVTNVGETRTISCLRCYAVWLLSNFTPRVRWLAFTSSIADRWIVSYLCTKLQENLESCWCHQLVLVIGVLLNYLQYGYRAIGSRRSSIVEDKLHTKQSARVKNAFFSFKILATFQFLFGPRRKTVERLTAWCLNTDYTTVEGVFYFKSIIRFFFTQRWLYQLYNYTCSIMRQNC